MPMQNEFDLLEKTIKDICGNKQVCYLANPGNWGDALIRHATKVFLKQKGINYNEIMVNEPKETINKDIPECDILLYGGGGAWCELWSHANETINKLRINFDRVIVLPSTFEKNFSIPNTTFFCRDIYESKNNMPGAMFCHDMAFYIGKLTVPKGSGTGYFFRLDSESSKKIDIPANNLDISLRGNHLSDIGLFFEYIAKYETIHTDRLHVAIASCLLGKELYLYPGSYFKNKSVYLSSIKDNFPNTYFQEI
jgi:exopolysaccharide biosynthesis predicted pyruvyltransferase EpsI